MQHLTQKEIQINIREVKKPEMDAQLVGDNIARQVEKRVSYKKAVKKAISTAMRMGAEGIKVTVSGRLNGAEIARTETFKEGRVPLHTLRADIDYADVNRPYDLRDRRRQGVDLQGRSHRPESENSAARKRRMSRCVAA